MLRRPNLLTTAFFHRKVETLARWLCNGDGIDWILIMNATLPLHSLAAGFLVLAASATPTSSPGAETFLKKSFTVHRGEKLTVSADRGNIEVKTSDSDKVEVEVKRRLDRLSDADAKKIFDEHEITLEQKGGEVIVRGEFKTKKPMLSRDESQLQVSYTLSIPQKFNVDLKTAGGGVTVGDLSGELRMKTAAGNLQAGRTDGPVFATTSGGSISIASAKTAETKTAAGNIMIGEVGEVSAETSGGSVEIKSAKGKIITRSAAGNIKLGSVEGDISASTSGGSIHVTKARGTLSAKTAAGNIDFWDVAGKGQGETSGGSITVAIKEQPKAECRLKTAAGNIRVTVPGDLAVDLDAATSAGNVTCDLPITIQGKRRNDALQGKINGGGPALVLKTSGGSVVIKKS